MRYWNWWCCTYNQKKKVKSGIDYRDMVAIVSSHMTISSGMAKGFQKMISTSKPPHLKKKRYKLLVGHVANYQCAIIAWKMLILIKSVLRKHHITSSDWKTPKITTDVLNAVSDSRLKFSEKTQFFRQRFLKIVIPSSIRIIFTKSDLIDFCLFVFTYLFPKRGTGWSHVTTLQSVRWMFI